MEEERFGREADSLMKGPMRLVLVVCEGQTEETFVRDVLAPAFYPRLNLIGQIIETSVGHKGGGLVYERVRRHLRKNLSRNSRPAVTTLIDLYKLDSNFPGYADAAGKPLAQRLATLNEALHQDIIGLTGCRPDQFLPHIQPYEFEALLFSDVETLTALNEGWAGAASVLQTVRDAAESPEHINDGPNTKPAARLTQSLTDPVFSKVLDGPRAAAHIGLARIEAECKFFAQWLDSLRALPSS